MPMNQFVFPMRALRLSILLLALAVAATADARTHSRKAKKAHKHASKEEHPGEFANFAQWREVAGFIKQMVAAHGFNKTELEAIMRKTRYVESAIQLMKPAPPDRPK